MKDKSRPGPIGKSCLTCRQRRKKCDRARPACERCKKGKFECRGYDFPDDKSSEGTSPEDSTEFVRVEHAQSSRSKSTGPTIAFISPITTRYSPDRFLDSDNTPSSTYSDVPNQSLLPCTSLFSPEQTTSSPRFDSSVSSQALQLQALVNASSSQPKPMYHLSARTLFLLLSRPADVSWLPMDVLDMSNFFMARFEKLIGLSFFTPSYEQIVKIRSVVTWRLQHFSSTRWSMFMCTKLFDSILSGTPLSDAENAALDRAMAQIEKLLYSTPIQQLTPAEARGRLSGSLELALFKLRANGTDTYDLLRNFAPTFIQLVFSDPALWPANSQSTLVSLAHVLESTNYEISHFVMLDMMCSMAYGLPPVIEYDTTTPPTIGEVHPAEIVHGCPVEMQFIMSEINRLCAWKQIGPIANWKIIEQKLRDWKPSVRPPGEEDSWKAVARLAVQESWRHTILIYLYMAVCGAASDDARVATSVRQIFRTTSTVKYELQPVADAHFYMQYVIGGAFTPNEKYRAIARNKLLDGVATKFWLLNVNNFVPVLDHLWHGAAANGRAIQWSDYVNSRQAILPISL